jgi:thiamine kinase-like enzyme
VSEKFIYQLLKENKSFSAVDVDFFLSDIIINKVICSEFNQVAFFKIKAKDLILKIFNSKPRNLLTEYLTLKRIEKLDIAPKAFLKGIFKNTAYILLEKIDGNLLQQDRLEFFLPKIIDNLNLLIDYSIKNLFNGNEQHNNCFTFILNYKKYVLDLIQNNLEALVNYNINQFSEAILKIDKILQKNERLFSQGKLVLIHTDLQSRNMIVTPHDKIKFVDWEYSKIGDPAFELSKLIHYNKISIDRLKCSNYLLLNEDEYLLDRIKLHLELMTLPDLLWSYIRHYNFVTRQLQNYQDKNLDFYQRVISQNEERFQKSIFNNLFLL